LSIPLNCAALLLLLSLSSFIPARAQDAQVAPTPEKARPKGVITGRVVGEDGQPLAGARVYVQSNRARGDAGGSAIAKPDGTFKVENLERAPYFVTANAPGFFDTAYLEFERGVRRFHHAGDHVTLVLARGGVITGRVVDAKGEPAIGVRINMVRIRTPDGKPVREVNRFMRSLERMTDDRGVYRNYGLLPGVYVVSAAGQFSQNWGGVTPHSEEAPTFYPSTTRDAASEVTLRAGEELSDVDIRLRGERGHAISGTVAGVMDAAHAEQATMIALISASTTEYHGQVFMNGRAGNEGFAFDSLSDGEYDLVAERYVSEGWRKIAVASRRVQVKGADVTGLRLTLLPVGSISGRLVFEKPTMEAKPSTNDSKPASVEAKKACSGSPEMLYGESAIVARREGGARSTPANEPSTLDTSFDDKGDFAFRGLGAGAYRLEVRLGEGYFVTSVRAGAASKTTTGKAAASATEAKTSASTTGALVRLRQGEDASGFVVTASYGAASLKGRITFPACDCPDAPTRVYMVPLERERADDPLRYAEAEIVRDKSSNGDFSFKGIAPGRYKLVAPPFAPQAAPEQSQQQQQPLFFSDEGRARLRRESERSDVSVTLAPCQSASGIGFIYVPPDKGGAGERRDK
jgi:protocatechuate 3,4-dioxygenase beta subunit